MTTTPDLKSTVDQQVRRLKRAERARTSLLAYSAYLGAAGILFVVPIVAGAYVGRWLDGLIDGYSVRWTVSLIVLGIAMGGAHVYLFFREP